MPIIARPEFLAALLAVLPFYSCRINTGAPGNPISKAQFDADTANITLMAATGHRRVDDVEIKHALAPYDLRLDRDPADPSMVRLVGGSLPCPVILGSCPEMITTMCHGHIVDAVVVRREISGKIVCKFHSHHTSGATRLWLDIGQQWAIAQGEEFDCTQVQIDRAAELLAKGN